MMHEIDLVLDALNDPLFSVNELAPIQGYFDALVLRMRAYLSQRFHLAWSLQRRRLMPASATLRTVLAMDAAAERARMVEATRAGMGAGLDVVPETPPALVRQNAQPPLIRRRRNRSASPEPQRSSARRRIVIDISDSEEERS